ncbi:MAG: pyridoxamine 5'-phosphate oxidase family protein [Desulfobacterales bacterium]|nr:pyridoxamine 5'-phosphate oxidase family protein [Desulfobacterales bacterium]
MTEPELKNTILQYLEDCNTLSLATTRDGIAHAASVFYVNRGFHLYFLSSPTSRHGENISLNPQVSATINADYSAWDQIKGIQLEGRVHNVGGILENARVAAAYVKKFPGVADFLFSPEKLGRIIADKIGRVHFYHLEPRRVYFINNEAGFGHRDELVLEQ